jgi:hypothetical protein
LFFLFCSPFVFALFRLLWPNDMQIQRWLLALLAPGLWFNTPHGRAGSSGHQHTHREVLGTESCEDGTDVTATCTSGSPANEIGELNFYQPGKPHTTSPIRIRAVFISRICPVFIFVFCSPLWFRFDACSELRLRGCVVS